MIFFLFRFFYAAVWVWVGCLTLTISGCVAGHREMENKNMGLDITFMIEQADMIYQHDPACWIKLKNAGATTLTIWDPKLVPGQPALTVLDVKTGQERHHSKKPPPGKPAVPREISLQPGETVTDVFRLRQRVGTLMPGKYELSAVYEYGEDQRHVKSSPVSITIRQATASHLSLVSGRGGAATFFYGAWVNVAAETPELTRTMFHFMLGGGVKNVLPVAPVDVRARPVVSAPRNTSAAPGQWFAWLLGDTLNALYFDEKKGASPALRARLQTEDATIVSPLYFDTLLQDGTPRGGALLCLGRPGAEGFQILSLGLTPGEATVEGSLNVAGVYPAWIESLVASDGSRRVVYVQTQDGDTSLWSTVWPHTTSSTGESVEPKLLASWSGRFLSAGFTATETDQILGTCLIWSEPLDEDLENTEEQSRLEFVQWSYRPDGKFIEKGKQEVTWTSEEPIEEARISVNGEGTPAALLKDQGGRWFVCGGSGDTQPAPGQFMETKLPIDLAFLGAEPVIVAAVTGLGFELRRLDGSPLPPRRKP